MLIVYEDASSSSVKNNMQNYLSRFHIVMTSARLVPRIIIQVYTQRKRLLSKTIVLLCITGKVGTLFACGFRQDSRTKSTVTA